MDKKYLLFGVHNHQPVENFEHVLKHAYDNCYKPFIDVVKKYPNVKVNLHFSGWLFEWLYKNHPDYLKEIKILIESGRIEMFAGGFYEPILPIFPQEDRIVQIKKLKNRIREVLGVDPKGLWLAERVWEQELVKTFGLSGIDYLPLDDSHFELSGIERDKLEGYYISEYEGYTVGVFPINKELRYMIPFESVENIINYMRKSSKKIFTFFDDGEKFGLWPGTYEHVYKKGWFDNFLQSISENDWIETLTFSEYFEKFNPSGRIYLPSSSYEEMLEWSLPSEIRNKLKRNEIKRNKFIGNWRNFFTKYTEANLMHKKILYVRSKIPNITEKKNDVVDAYLRSQANDAFWHGWFGGVYLPHLRKSVYKNIIFAENEVHKPKGEEIDIFDFDCDGSNEVLLSNKNLNIYIDPDYGGRIFEMDIRDKFFNVQNTMTRRYEPYHDKLNGIAELSFDWYERFSLIDHFFGDNTSLKNFSKAEYEELGDFVNQPFQYEISNDKIVTLWRKGHVWFYTNWVELELSKSIKLFNNKLLLNYRFSNISNFEVSFWYGCEFNFCLLSDKNGRYIEIENEKFELYEFKEIKTDRLDITDLPDGFKIKVSTDKAIRFWIFPIYTVSYSETGPERIFQSVCVVPNVKFKLCPNDHFELRLSLAFESL